MTTDDLPVEDRPPSDFADLDTTYTIIGVWPETQERYAEHVRAASPRQAEDLAQMTAREKGGVLWVCGVFEGAHQSVDTYATFIDPDRTTEASW
jgi:hypothetical protein